MPKLAKNLSQPAWWIMTLLAVSISGYAFVYFFADGLGGDLKEKFATIPLAAWSHIVGGGLALLIGAFQMNAFLRKKALKWHRTMGRIYLVCVLASGVGGVILAWHAQGGFLTRLGFGLLAIMWLYTGAMAYHRIKQRDVGAHRRWMIRNYALTFAAVTLRVYLPISLMAGASFAIAYGIIAWMCWLPNLVLAEWLFIQRPLREASRTSVGKASVSG